MPDALNAAITLMEADPTKLIHRNAFNIASMSFDPETIYHSTGFLRRMVTAMPMMPVCYPMIIQFQAMGKFKESLICSILRKGVLDIPLLFLMNGLLGLYGCMWVQPIVDTVSLIAAAGFYRRLKKAEGI